MLLFASTQRLQLGGVAFTHFNALHVLGVQNVDPEQSSVDSHSTQIPPNISLQN